MAWSAGGRKERSVPTLGPLEILVILIVALVVFGPNKLPDIARQVGKGMSEFRRVQHQLRRELDDAVHSVMDEDTTPSGGTSASASGNDALDATASTVDGSAATALEPPAGAAPDVGVAGTDSASSGDVPPSAQPPAPTSAEDSSSEPTDPNTR